MMACRRSLPSRHNKLLKLRETEKRVNDKNKPFIVTLINVISNNTTEIENKFKCNRNLEHRYHRKQHSKDKGFIS